MCFDTYISLEQCSLFLDSVLCSYVGLPAAPGNLKVEFVTRDSVTIKWDAPKDTGGVPLSGYILEQQDGKSARWHVAAYTDPMRTSWTLTNLIQGYEYTFRVRAENPDGAGPACTLTTSVIPKPVVCKLPHHLIFFLSVFPCVNLFIKFV